MLGWQNAAKPGVKQMIKIFSFEYIFNALNLTGPAKPFLGQRQRNFDAANLQGKEEQGALG